MVETNKIKEILERLYKVAKRDSKQAAEFIAEEAKGAGTGKTAVNKGLIGNPVKLTRRALVYASLTGLFVHIFEKTGDMAVGRAIDKGLDQVAEAADKYLGEDLFADDVSFQSEFIDWLHKNREKPELIHNAPPNLQDIEKKIINILSSFRRGSYLNTEEASTLSRIAKGTSDHPTRLAVTDIITGQLVRAGNCSESARKLSIINAQELKNTEEKLLYVEKALSIKYTSIRREHALSPEKWEYHPAIKMAENTGLKECGINITDGSSGLRLTIEPELLQPADGPLSGIKAFYTIHLLLQWYAASNPDQIAETTRLRIALLKSQARRPGLERGTWNMAYIAGMHCHRQGIVSNNAHNEFELRNQYFDILFGGDPDFWHKFRNRATADTFSAEDTAATGLILLVASDKNTGLRSRYHKVASPRILLESRSAIKATAVQRAVDQLRIKLNQEITNYAAASIYTADDHSLEIHLPSSHEIRAIDM